MAERIVVPASPEGVARIAAAKRATEIRALRSKGNARTPQDRDRLLDLLAEQILNS